MIINSCVREGEEEYLQIGHDQVRGLHYAVVKDKETNLVTYFMWLHEDYQKSLELSERINIH